jgi:hypothetical protein
MSQEWTTPRERNDVAQAPRAVRQTEREDYQHGKRSKGDNIAGLIVMAKRSKVSDKSQNAGHDSKLGP